MVRRRIRVPEIPGSSPGTPTRSFLNIKYNRGMANPFRSEKFRKIFIGNIALALAVIGLGVGTFLAWQYNDKLPQVITPAVPYLSLQEMESTLEGEQRTLKQQIAKTDDQINALADKVKIRQSGMKGLIDAADRLKAQAGITQAKGSGIKIILADSDSPLNVTNAIAHASDLRDLINQLWQNGAEAISISGAGSMEERVGPLTSIDCIVNTVLINGTKTVPPFEIKVLGDRDRLISAINDRTALKSIYDRVDKEGLKFTIDDNVKEVDIASFTGNIITEHVKIK